MNLENYLGRFPRDENLRKTIRKKKDFNFSSPREAKKNVEVLCQLTQFRFALKETKFPRFIFSSSVLFQEIITDCAENVGKAE